MVFREGFRNPSSDYSLHTQRGELLNNKYMPARLKLDDKAIIQGYLDGKTCYELGREFNCGFKTILRRLHNNNVKIRDTGINKLSDKNFEDIINEYESGDTTIIDIALKYHVHYSIISNILKNRGVPEKKRAKQIIITEDEEKEIVRLYQSKELSFSQICKKYCNYKKRIEDILIKHGIKYKPNNFSFIEQETEDIIINAYINDKLTILQIAEKCNLPYQRVRTLLSKKNLIKNIETRLKEKYSEELINNLVDLNFNKNQTLTDIETITKLDYSVIKRLIEYKKEKIKRNDKNKAKLNSPEEECLVVEHYRQHNNIIKASRDFKVSQKCITRILKKNKVYKETEFYQYNENYFDSIDSHEKAYILGMIATDGCNSVGKGVLNLTLKSDDLEIVKKINRELSIDKPVVVFKVNKENYSGEFVRMTIHSKKISNRLEELGLPERKTFKLKPEFWMTGEFSNSAILGMMDGDGSIYKRTRLHKKRTTMETSWTFSFIGMKSICQMMQKIFKEVLNINSGVAPHTRYKNNLEKPLCVIRVYGNIQVKKLLDWIYKDCVLRMDRKYLRYLELCEYSNQPKRINQFC